LGLGVHAAAVDEIHGAEIRDDVRRFWQHIVHLLLQGG
jgi:hypothetical protein